MDRDQIRRIIVTHTKDVVEGLEDVDIDTSRPVAEYGVESLDILEIVGSSAQEAGVKVKREHLEGLQSIDDLVDLYARLNGA